MRVYALLFAALSAAGCAGSAPAPAAPRDIGFTVSPQARSVVDAPDRAPEDRALDASRRPAELLTFLGLRSGMRVGEIIAGAGYTAELLARAVAPGGVVYAENPRAILVSSGDPWAARLATPAAKDIVRVDRELDDPFPPEAKDLDVVLVNLVYHDTVWLHADRAAMNRSAFTHLKKGGKYVVIDHSARPGTGLADVQTLHRIDEHVVRAEVEAAGFVLETAESVFRNPSDTRDWNDSPATAGSRRGTSDKFMLRFVKP